MGEYNGKINVSKDTMLFVANDIFDKGIKENTTKENILKMIPKIYEEADEKKIIKMLPHGTYNVLEKLIEYVKTSDDIKEFIYDKNHQDTRYLESKYMNEIITEAELNDLFFTRLNLNTFVNDYIIKWTNINEVQVFLTYLDEEYCPINIGVIAEEQKARNLRYKQFSKQEILKREEDFYDDRAQKLYKFLKTKNPNLIEWTFKRLIKMNELGLNILGEISNMCMFENEEELEKFMELYTEWYNNSPQYMLGGYSPIEFGKLYK